MEVEPRRWLNVAALTLLFGLLGAFLSLRIAWNGPDRWGGFLIGIVVGILMGAVFGLILVAYAGRADARKFEVQQLRSQALVVTGQRDKRVLTALSRVTPLTPDLP